MKASLAVRSAQASTGGVRGRRLETLGRGRGGNENARSHGHEHDGRRRGALSAEAAGFDPGQPEDGALIVAGVLRDQFNGLHEMIEAVPTVTGAVVDSVMTLSAGSPATVSAMIENGVLHLTFGIPEGGQGGPGPEGPPGPVTPQDLTDAISYTALNPYTVRPLDMPVSDPPTQGEVQSIVSKLDELINALTRM